MTPGPDDKSCPRPSAQHHYRSAQRHPWTEERKDHRPNGLDLKPATRPTTAVVKQMCGPGFSTLEGRSRVSSGTGANKRGQRHSRPTHGSFISRVAIDSDGRCNHSMAGELPSSWSRPQAATKIPAPRLHMLVQPAASKALRRCAHTTLCHITHTREASPAQRLIKYLPATARQG